MTTPISRGIRSEPRVAPRARGDAARRAFDRALFGLVDPDGGSIRARLALGPDAESFSHAFQFPLGSNPTAITSAVIDREPAFLTRATFSPRDARIAKQLGAVEFGLLPLVIEGRAIGCLYCDRRLPGAGPNPATLMFLGRLQTIAEQAIGGSRRGGAAAGSSAGESPG